MKPVYLTDSFVWSALGNGNQAQLHALQSSRSGIQLQHLPGCEPVYAACISAEEIDAYTAADFPVDKFTRLERMMLYAIEQVLRRQQVDLASPDTLLILSTTKGNVHLLDAEQAGDFPGERVYLGALARAIGDALHCAHLPLVVSNACISGVLAIIMGSRMLRAGRYRQVVVCGGDLVSQFVVSGFQSLKAVGSGPCRPYDATRDGISLGEAAAALLLTADTPPQGPAIEVLAGASTNDANHISGPSRTGEGLVQAVNQCLHRSGCPAGAIEFISAHGTATLYNDEMESIAFGRTGLEKVPLNSFKGFIGHTLGAAGVTEAALSVLCMQVGMLPPTEGFEQLGVSHPLNVVSVPTKQPIRLCLKTASGFGGCNAAVLFRKEA